jgi:competence protein ComEC
MWFVLLTRAEPSVLRAAFMAGVVATNAAIGRKQNARVVLALTVIALLIIDPLLAWSVGFALSVGATAGLAWFSGRLGKLVGGRGVAAATLAAQLGTAPVSLAVFGSVPVVSLLANPLALGVAGAVMMFGLPIALLAGVFPALVTPISWVLTVPVAYVSFVARMAAHMSPHGLWNALLWACVPLWLLRRRRQSARRPTAVAG